MSETCFLPDRDMASPLTLKMGTRWPSGWTTQMSNESPDREMDFSLISSVAPGGWTWKWLKKPRGDG